MRVHRIIDQRPRRSLIQLLRQLLHALPRNQQRRPDDENNRSAEQKLALGSEGDVELADLFEHFPKSGAQATRARALRAYDRGVILIGWVMSSTFPGNRSMCRP